MPWDMDVRDADWRQRSPEQLDALERQSRQCEQTDAQKPARPQGRMTGADRARLERGSRG
jgi:hypothetical protein